MNYRSKAVTQADINRRFALAMAQPAPYRLRLKGDESPQDESPEARKARSLAECKRIMGGR